MKMKRSYEDQQENIRSLKTPKINVWKNKYPDKEYTVFLQIPEFTCICPKTGLPDFAIIRVEYGPHKYCLELKSFKMYTLFFRNVGIFHEHVVNKILEDIVKACSPRWLRVVGEFNVRGGIKTEVRVEYKRPH
ncbi:MAG: NADPH-dependent 7-cyano-7-deazaguanine reductase QueF [Candidatus Omnitrophica bacterium]|nr:NADPH-dependent 7-cyano-7-deazaguanine reductase QueF [Candidatus Omnitrophota bacterium]